MFESLIRAVAILGLIFLFVSCVGRVVLAIAERDLDGDAPRVPDRTRPF